jgi:hypothetical protein
LAFIESEDFKPYQEVLPPAHWWNHHQLDILSDRLLLLQDSFALFLACKILLNAKMNISLAISRLIYLFGECNNPDLHWDVTELLMENLSFIELMNLAMDLKRKLEENFSQGKLRWKYIHCEEVISNCAANLCYLDFYRSFHNFVSPHPEMKEYPMVGEGISDEKIAPSLNGLCNFDNVKKRFSNQCFLITLSSDSGQNKMEICKRLLSRIFLSSASDLAIPEIKDVGDLEKAILQLKVRLDNQFQGIIFYETEPKATLVSTCLQFSDIVHIGWITDQPVPFRTFHPNSTNLVSAIQSWLDEIAQE